MTSTPDPLAAVRPSDAFSQSYAEARAKFRSVAAAAGAMLTEHAHPLKGPAGEDLACDVARFGPMDAEAVLWINSATHGVEGFCGSGVQIGMMARGWPSMSPAAPRISTIRSFAVWLVAPMIAS